MFFYQKEERVSGRKVNNEYRDQIFKAFIDYGGQSLVSILGMKDVIRSLTHGGMI